ncbi:MAG TPA: hypothetical protein VMF58_05610 [Rhizomicrobium sp.]|nr:hypothetical protein [Rhizomicrobium sp.]
MSDIYTDEDYDDQVRPGALELLRAEARRFASQLEQRLQASASDVMDETRMLARRAEYRIHSRFGTAALIALGSGVALGLLAAVLSSRGARRRGR